MAASPYPARNGFMLYIAGLFCFIPYLYYFIKSVMTLTPEHGFWWYQLPEQWWGRLLYSAPQEIQWLPGLQNIISMFISWSCSSLVGLGFTEPYSEHMWPSLQPGSWDITTPTPLFHCLALHSAPQISVLISNTCLLLSARPLLSGKAPVSPSESTLQCLSSLKVTVLHWVVSNTEDHCLIYFAQHYSSLCQKSNSISVTSSSRSRSLQIIKAGF